MDDLNPKTILVVQIGKIGDMVLTTPLFSCIKELYPHSQLTVMASSLNRDIAFNHSSVDEVITFKKNMLGNLFLLKSKAMKADLWIDTKNNYSITSELLLKIFNPGKSLGFNFEKKIFDIDLSEFQKGVHAVDINLSPINYLRGSDERLVVKPSFQIPSDLVKKVGSVLRANPYAKKVLLNVSAGDSSRYLKNGKWIDIINQIYQSHFYSFYLIGMEKDMESIDLILKETKRLNARFIRTNNIIEASEVIRQCDVAISADTSVVHICSAFNVPVIALYPDVKWNLEKFAPLSDLNEVIVSGKPDSIDDINAEKIVNSFKSLISSIR